jgi:protein SCO1/2
VSRSWWLLTVLALVLAACGGGGDGDSGAGEPGASGAVDSGDEGPYEGIEVEPFAKPDFVLTDVATGEPYDFAAQTEGALTLLYFGYTTCPDICPVHLAQLANVVDRPDMPANTRVVVVTVDPERDTPEVFREYLDNFSTDFVGLWGTPEEVEEVQRNVPTIAPGFKVPDEELGYTVAHAGQVVAFAPDGNAYVIYGERTRQTNYVHDLPLLAEIEAEGA